MSGSCLRFREVMRGAVAYGARGDQPGAGDGGKVNRMRLRLTIEVDDLDRFIADPNREAAITGQIEWEPLGGRLRIERGVFNLLLDDPATGRKAMRYRLFFRDGAGHPVTLVGVKRVGAPGFRVWSDTTTLHACVLSGHVESAGPGDAAVLLAAGVLRLHPLAFAQQMTSFRATGRSRVTRIGAIARFQMFFLRQLWLAYGWQGWPR